MKQTLFAFFLVMTSCQETPSINKNLSSIDRFLIKLSSKDFAELKTECKKKKFTSLNEKKLEERMKSLDTGFIKSLFVLCTCSDDSLKKSLFDKLGEKVFLFSPQIFFENLMVFKNKIPEWKEIVLVGNKDTLKKKLGLIRDAPTDTPVILELKNEVRELIKSSL